MKRKSSSKQTQGVVLPKDYIWKLLGWALTDLAEFLPPDITEKFRHVIRTRDYTLYRKLCEEVALQKFKYNATASSDEVAAMRFLTLAEKYLDFPNLPFNATSRKETALQKFEEAERVCYKQNRKVMFNANDDVFFGPVIQHAKKFVNNVLGELKPFHILYKGRHGPGSNLSTVKSRTSLFDKHVPPFTVTSEAAAYFSDVIINDHRWLRALLAYHFRDPRVFAMSSGAVLRRYFFLELTHEQRESFWSGVLRIVDHNRVTTVPKKIDTDRTIAIEPSGNLYLQLGVDDYIRQRLKRFGIDLDTQEKNKRLAKESSLDDLLATVDLSAASDSISLRIVGLLFPEEWTEFLLSLRSPNGLLPGGISITYEKLSSMGNGYTFVIETLIFAALLYGVIRVRGGEWHSSLESISIYGDDIILPRECFHDYHVTLRKVGFKVNVDKTFLSGCIRESCGGDYFRGVDVRPPYIKQLPKHEHEVILQRNLLFVYFVRRFGREPVEMGKMDHYIRPQRRVYGPYGEELFSWLFSFTRGKPTYISNYQAEGYFLSKYVSKRTPDKVPYFLRYCFQDLVHSLKAISTPRNLLFDQIPASGTHFTVVGRNSRQTVERRRTLVFNWPLNLQNLELSLW